MVRLGIIGYGGRARGLMPMMKRLNAGVEIAAITDVRNDEVKRILAEDGDDPSKIAFYDDPDSMMDSEKLDGVMVSTRCSMHTKIAKKVFARNLPMFLEKPVATNLKDLAALRDAGEKSKSKVVVSFPLRVTPIVQLAKEIIDSGKVGTVENVQAWNDVSYGWHYYQLWYRDENETQGLFLQKATHDFDYINYLVGIKPVWICAMNAKRIFKGDRPAGLKCDDCDEWDECLESPFHNYYTKQELTEVGPTNRMCCFAEDTGNEDSGSALIEYETGMHAAYSQNFFARKDAGRRGARFYGYKGTIEFGWYTDEVKVYMHQAPRVETYKTYVKAGSHGGGDTVLCDNFVRVMRGEQESISPLSAGILSALMCLKAKESAATRTFQKIEF